MAQGLYYSNQVLIASRNVLTACCLLLSDVAYGQGSYYSNNATTVSKALAPGQSAPVLTLPYAKVYVCAAPASPLSGGACVNQVQVYSDAATTQPLPQPLSADAQGNFGFYVAPGQYSYSIVNVFGSWLLTTPFTVSGPNGNTSVAIESYPGADVGAKLQAAITVNGSAAYTVNSPGTFSSSVTIPDGASILFNTSITGWVGTITGSGHNRIACRKGASLSGLGESTGTIFFNALSGAGYDLFENCTIHDVGRAAYLTGTTTTAVSHVRVHDAEIYNVFDAMDVGNGSTAVTSSDPSQPIDVKFYNNYVHDSDTAANVFNTHGFEGFGNTCKNLTHYCAVGSGHYNVYGYLAPYGDMSEFNAHNNHCDGVQACEWVTAALNTTIGQGSYATNVTDVAFDVEGSDNSLISGAQCGTVTNGCATTFFRIRNLVISNIVAPTGNIFLRNNSQQPSGVAQIKVFGNVVNAIVTNAVQDLDAYGNYAASYQIGFNDRLNLHDNTCNTTASTCFAIGSPFNGNMAQVRNNTAITTASTGQAFTVASGYFNSATIATFSGNRSIGFSNFFTSNTNQPNNVPATYYLDGNYRGSATVVNNNVSGTMANGTIIESSYFGVNGALTLSPANGVTCSGTPSSSYTVTNGVVTHC